MSEIFKDELKRLRIHFVEMGINVNEQIYRATKAFTSHDRALADQVLELDRQINDQEVTLEKQALKLMALQQPLANDFRLIISILKASNDIERLGDYASHIARSAKHVRSTLRPTRSDKCSRRSSMLLLTIMNGRRMKSPKKI